MRRLACWLIVFGFLVLLIPGVLAQSSASQPIYAVVQGELLRTTPDRNALEPVAACALTNEHVLQSPVVSPDGRLLAVRIEPRLVTEAQERVGGWGGGENPSDIAVCDPETGFVTRFNQPDEAALFDPSGRPDFFLIRSVPAWSADGRELAWTECEPGCQNAQIRVYSIDTGELRTLAGIPPQYGVPTSVPVAWGGPLILVSSVEPNSANGGETSRLYGFDPATGAQTLTVPVTQGENDFSFAMAFFWSDLESAPRIIYLRSSGAWIAIDPTTGESSLLDGTPELYSPSNPDGLTALADARAAQAMNLRWL
ncbi:MAG: hypothetical protein U0452_16005, partial [Anaerolineae bacterium]